MNTKLRIIVSGLVGLYPVGGVAWDYLQYVVGLSKLGHDVYYHEDTSRWPFNPIENEYVADGDYSANFIGNFFEAFAPELLDKWHYLHIKEKSFGMNRNSFDEISRTADLFINVSGACYIPDFLSQDCIKVFIDTDPGYNQVILSEKPEWSDKVDDWCKSIADHDVYFTYAENINSSDCIIPKVGFAWKTTRMPIVIDFWKHSSNNHREIDAPWTTVMSWNKFNGKLTYEDVEYRGKGYEFEKFIELPKLIGIPLKIALGGFDPPFDLLEIYGWEVLDGPKATLTPKRYQELIAGSRGEISIAKNIYTAMRTGWFSCRSACYLAAGRPVVTQDTGFSKFLPTGEGLFAFNTMDEILSALDAINSEFERHSDAARRIAVEYFSAETVLKRLIENIGF